MRGKSILVLMMLAALCLIVPLSLYAYSTRSELDHFLSLRKDLLRQLDANAAKLPDGFEHVIEPRNRPPFPPDEHIRSVVRGGNIWFADNFASHDLRITGEFDDTTASEAVTTLFAHLQTGIAELGLSSPKSGGPDWIVENRRAAHSRYWRDPGSHLIVTLTVVVDIESKSAHVTRYVHERFE